MDMKSLLSQPARSSPAAVALAAAPCPRGSAPPASAPCRQRQRPSSGSLAGSPRGGKPPKAAVDQQLEHFLDVLNKVPDFSELNNSSSMSLLDQPSFKRDGVPPPDEGGAGPVELPEVLDEETVLDILTVFLRRRVLRREVAAELLRRHTAHLEALGNVVEFDVPEGAVLTVVGDLHGQFNDLMHIFRSHGLPCPSRPYLFNGVFGDRGDRGVEITLTLFALQQLYPASVFLNRGNHEEHSVHQIYGFQQECKAKYDHDMYEAFNSTFAQLPIAHIVNKAILVVHGGIDSKVTLDALRSAPRSEYTPSTLLTAFGGGRGGKPGLIHPAMRDKVAAMMAKEQLVHPIHAALWNDPIEYAGEGPNKARGTAMLFGPDIAREFLEREGLQLIIRSHDKMQFGFDWPYGDGVDLVTVFSASHYACSADNRGGLVRVGAIGSKPPEGVRSAARPPSPRASRTRSAARADKKGRARGAADDDPPTPGRPGEGRRPASAAARRGWARWGSRGQSMLGSAAATATSWSSWAAAGAAAAAASGGGGGSSSSLGEESSGSGAPAAPPPMLGGGGAASPGGGGVDLGRAAGCEGGGVGGGARRRRRGARRATTPSTAADEEPLLPTTVTAWYDFPFGALACESYDLAASSRSAARSAARTTCMGCSSRTRRTSSSTAWPRRPSSTAGRRRASSRSPSCATCARRRWDSTRRTRRTSRPSSARCLSRRAWRRSRWRT